MDCCKYKVACFCSVQGGRNCLTIPDFSDDTGGVNIYTSTIPDGWICGWEIPEVEGYDWALMPRTDGVAANEQAASPEEGLKGVADDCEFLGPALNVGAYWRAIPLCGPFSLFSVAAAGSNDNTGARLQKIPGGGLGVATPSIPWNDSSDEGGDGGGPK